MIPKEELKKRIFLRLLAHPASLYPSMGGLSFLMLQWGFQITESVVTFLGVSGIMVGAGMFFINLFSRDKIAARVINEIQQQEISRKEKELDTLEAELKKDGDPRTENLLKELRTLCRLIKEKTEEQKKFISIAYNVSELFNHCLEQLKKTLRIHEEIHKLPENTGAGNVLTGRREKIIEEITKTVENLQQTLQHLVVMSDEDTVEDLSELNRELSVTLEVARKVDQEIDELRKSERIKE